MRKGGCVRVKRGGCVRVRRDRCVRVRRDGCVRVREWGFDAVPTHFLRDESLFESGAIRN